MKSKEMINQFKMVLPSFSLNESFARKTVSAFIGSKDPTLSEIADIRTVVSEAVTNCIVHAYKEKAGLIYISGKLYDDGRVEILIRDKGCGIEDVEKAMEPLYTTDTTGERGGMGFAIMKTFTDRLYVKSEKGKGTTVKMVKKIGNGTEKR